MKQPECTGCNGDHYGRRDFVRVGALSALGIHLSQYVRIRGHWRERQHLEIGWRDSRGNNDRRSGGLSVRVLRCHGK